MMELKLSGTLAGCVTVPPSKSIAHRILICNALADEPSRFICGEAGDDVNVTADCLRSLGATIKHSDDEYRIWPIGENLFRHCRLDCGESGSTLRFLLPIAAALGADATFTGSGRLSQRPLSPLYEEMTRHGVVMTPNGELPLSCNGRLSGGDYTLDAGVSSQFISGLLFALPLAEEDSRLTLTGDIQSGPYIDLTLNALLHAGISVERNGNVFNIKGRQRYGSTPACLVEGDWSAAAFWTVAGTVGQSPITIRGVDPERSLQGDRAIVSILRGMGAEIRGSGNEITVFPSQLECIETDCSDTPDLVPALAVAAACAKGRSIIRGVRRLRLKESDRISTIMSMLGNFGIACEASDDSLTVTGGRPHACHTDSYRDHRIAMASAVLASVCDGETLLGGAECVAKSYPDFFNDFRTLGGHLD